MTAPDVDTANGSAGLTEKIYEGVYTSFNHVPVHGEGFNGQIWLDNSRSKTLELLAASANPDTVPASPSYNTSLLPFLACLIHEKQGGVTILDFGGNLGSAYISLINGMAEPACVEYHVVEVEQICELGGEIFAEDQQIRFHSEIPSGIQAVDIVHIGTTLQYIEDWESLLVQLADYQPSYFLFSNLQAGDVPTFATAQYYYGSRIACWFFNAKDVIAAMSSSGFELLFKSTFDATILGRRQELPMDNFPEAHRLPHACNLLFRRRQQ